MIKVYIWRKTVVAISRSDWSSSKKRNIYHTDIACFLVPFQPSWSLVRSKLPQSLCVCVSLYLSVPHTQTLHASLPFPFFSVTSSVIRKYTTSYILYVIHLQDVSCVCSKNLLKINSWWTYLKGHNTHIEKRSSIYHKCIDFLWWKYVLWE